MKGTGHGVKVLCEQGLRTQMVGCLRLHRKKDYSSYWGFAGFLAEMVGLQTDPSFGAYWGSGRVERQWVYHVRAHEQRDKSGRMCWLLAENTCKIFELIHFKQWVFKDCPRRSQLMLLVGRRHLQSHFRSQATTLSTWVAETTQSSKQTKKFEDALRVHFFRLVLQEMTTLESFTLLCWGYVSIAWEQSTWATFFSVTWISVQWVVGRFSWGSPVRKPLLHDSKHPPPWSKSSEQIWGIYNQDYPAWYLQAKKYMSDIK